MAQFCWLVWLKTAASFVPGLTPRLQFASTLHEPAAAALQISFAGVSRSSSRSTRSVARLFTDFLAQALALRALRNMDSMAASRLGKNLRRKRRIGRLS